MTYTQRMRQQYAALILLGRAWRESYRQLRACGWPHTAAIELANLTVTMG